MTNKITQPTTTTAIADLAEERLRIILSQRECIKYLESVAAEYKTFRAAFGSSETTYSQAMQSVLTQQNAAAQADRSRRDYEIQSRRDAEAADRYAEAERQVLASHPDLTTRLTEGRAALEKDTQANSKLVNRWFDMSGEDFEKYLSHSTKISESPVNNIITIEEQNAAGSTVKKINYYICDACYGSSYLSLNLIEKHIFEEDHEMHRDAVLSKIDSEKTTKLAKLNAEYTTDIQNYIRSKAEQDYMNQQKQQRAAATREKNQLPFLKGGNN